MSRIIRFYKLGGPEVLQIEDIDTPLPRPGQVCIRVKAIGLNRADVMFRQGHYIEEAILPSRLGYEASGVIDAVGKGISEFKVGDEVSVIPQMDLGQNGTYGEIIVAPERLVVRKPASISFTEAAAVWMQYITAYGGLIMVGQLKPRDFIVITAASSSVGLAAIQIADFVGAVPIATTLNTNQKRAVEAAGVRHVIATEEESFVSRLHEIAGGKGIRVIFDAVGGPHVVQLADAMSPGGILVAHGMLSPDPTPFPLKTAISKSLTMRGYVFTEVVTSPEHLAGAKRFILDGLESGYLKPLIAKTFPFDEVQEAHRYLESNRQIGKVVVTVQEG
jgi:NADPH:quinone reductase-like Zn-dependent oxidoreductase